MNLHAEDLATTWQLRYTYICARSWSLQRRARAGNVHNNIVVLISGYPVTRPAHQIANYMPLGKPDKLARIPTDYKGSNQPAGAAKMRKVDPTLVSIQ